MLMLKLVYENFCVHPQSPLKIISDTNSIQRKIYMYAPHILKLSPVQLGGPEFQN